ncbi:MAG: hypothetical protein ACRC3H_08250 [Lachnospiraceae bacterium]
MKKKLIILAGVVLIIGVLGKIVFANASVDHPISMEWEIQEQNIEAIEFVGCPQKMNVAIQQTEDEITKVQVEGSVSEQIAEDLKDVIFEDGKLCVKLGSTSMVGLEVIPDEDDELVVTIQLGKDATVASYLMGCTEAVSMQVPEEYEGVFDLDTNNKGTIVNVPETEESDDTVIKVDAVGDIDIVK